MAGRSGALDGWAAVMAVFTAGPNA